MPATRADRFRELGASEPVLADLGALPKSGQAAVGRRVWLRLAEGCDADTAIRRAMGQYRIALDVERAAVAAKATRSSAPARPLDERALAHLAALAAALDDVPADVAHLLDAMPADAAHRLRRAVRNRVQRLAKKPSKATPEERGALSDRAFNRLDHDALVEHVTPRVYRRRVREYLDG